MHLRWISTDMAWVSLKELHEQTGFAVRTLQYIRAQEPGVLVTRDRSGRTEYKQPDSASNLFRRERELAKRDAVPANFDEARSRKMDAEAREAELRVEQVLGSMVPLAVVDDVVGRVCGRMLPILQNAPSNYTLRLEELGVPPDKAQSVLESIATDLTQALQSTADEHDAEASEDDAGDQSAA